jgi:hypothetical protein
VSEVVETTQIPVTPAVAQAAGRGELGQLRQAFMLLTKVRLFGKPREEEKFRVYEYEDGLVREGGNMPLVVFRWDQVRTVFQSSTAHFENGRYKGTTFAYKLTRNDGAEFSIDGRFMDPRRAGRAAAAARPNQHQRWADFGEAVTRYVAGQQLLDAQATLTIGQQLAFGDIVISMQGVHTQKFGVVPWSQIKDVQVRSGTVQIRKEGKFLSLSSRPVGRIPNFVLFMVLVDALRKGPGA